MYLLYFHIITIDEMCTFDSMSNLLLRNTCNRPHFKIISFQVYVFAIISTQEILLVKASYIQNPKILSYANFLNIYIYMYANI